MKYKNMIFFFAFMLFSIPSCRYIHWGKSVVYQGCKRDICCVKDVEKYIKTGHLYDGLTTLGHFNAMWLSDVVKQCYEKVHTERMCTQCSDGFLKDCKNTFCFYLLVATPHDCKYLYEELSSWDVCLEINGKEYPYNSLEKVCLVPEIKRFFGIHYTRSKVPYLISFDVPSLKNAQKFSLVFKTLDRSLYLTWCLTSDGCIIESCCPITQELAYDLDCPECQNC